jgi:hypothetical protein
LAHETETYPTSFEIPGIGVAELHEPLVSVAAIATRFEYNPTARQLPTEAQETEVNCDSWVGFALAGIPTA